VRRLERLTSYKQHSGCVNSLNFNESGMLLASGSDDLNIMIYDWIKSRPIVTFKSGHRLNVFQSKFMPFTNDIHIVTTARDGQVRLALLSSTGACKGTKKLAQHRGAAHKLATVHDSAHVFYTCGEDAVTLRVDLRENKPTKCYMCKEGQRKIPLYSIHANPFNSFEHVVGGRDQYIRVYDTRNIDKGDDSCSLVKKFAPHHLVGGSPRAHLTCAVFNYNGTEILGTYNDEDIYLFDNAHSDGAQYTRKYTGHRNSATVKGVNFFGPRSEFVVSGSDCGNVFIWERTSQEIVNYFHADDGGVVNVLEPHPHLPILATSGLDNDVRLWMPTTDQPNPMGELKRVMRTNKRERDMDRNMPTVIDSQMLWFLMQSLRRSSSRLTRSAAALGLSDLSSSSDADSSSSSEVDSSEASRSPEEMDQEEVREETAEVDEELEREGEIMDDSHDDTAVLDDMRRNSELDGGESRNELGE
jgi:WD repeat-containing protein 42A